MMIYNGYVYIWYDTVKKFFYIGSHYGLVEDRYICSSKSMMRAYKKRSDTFKFRVLEYIIGTLDDLHNCEQKWLDKINDNELMTSKNIRHKTCRYYNVKKTAWGGSGKGSKKSEEWKRKQSLKQKGKPKFSIEKRKELSIQRQGRIPWNKGLKEVQIPGNKGKKASLETKLNMECSWVLRRIEKGMWGVKNPSLDYMVKKWHKY